MTSSPSVPQQEAPASAVLVWHGSDPAGRALASRIEAAAGPLPLSLTEEPAEGIAAALQADPARRALLICPAPVPALVQALAAGTPAAEALESWCATARSLLQVQRAHRRRVRLSAAGAGAAGAVAGWLGLPALPEAATGAPDPLQALLARSLLLSNPGARALAEELDAACADAESVLAPVDTGRALEAAAELRRGAAEAGGLRDTRQRLLRQIFEVEQELGRARFRETALEAQVSDLDGRLGAVGAELAGKAELEQALERYRGTEGQLRDSLAERGRQLDIAEARLQDTAARLEAAQTERDRLKNINRQLDEGLQSHQALLREAGERIEALTGQAVALHGVREELEGWYDRARAEEERRLAEAAAADARQAELERALAERGARLAEAEAELDRYRAGWLARFSTLFGRKDR